MSNTSDNAIEHFLHGQIACWNAKDRDGFFAHYRAASPNGLTIEYVGQPPRDAWRILEDMWEKQAPKIQVEVKATIINGNEAACHHLNKVIGTDFAIPTIELYSFGQGKLSVRYFIGS